MRTAKNKSRLQACLEWNRGTPGRREEHGADGRRLRVILCVIAVASAIAAIIGLFREFID